MTNTYEVLIEVAYGHQGSFQVTVEVEADGPEEAEAAAEDKVLGGMSIYSYDADQID